MGLIICRTQGVYVLGTYDASMYASVAVGKKIAISRD